MARDSLLILACLISLSCADDSGDQPIVEDAGGTTAGASTGSEDTDNPAETSGGIDDATDDETADGAGGDENAVPPPAEELPYARAIRLDRITANQAIQVGLVIDGIETEIESRAVRMVANRRTLVRGFWSLHPDFEPRLILGRLTVDYPDGTVVVHEDTVMVDGESSDGGASFQWMLSGQEAIDGIKYRAKLLDPDVATAPGELSVPPPVAPLAGKGTIAFADTPMELQVVLVPIEHNFDGCSQTPAITEDDVETLRRHLEQNNPVSAAVLTIRDEPLVWTEETTSGFSPILAALAELRATDGPADNIYYYGLLDSCDERTGLAGQALSIPSNPQSRAAAAVRVSMGRMYTSMEATASTFTHEIGHSQGRYHVRCSGGEAGADLEYPHQSGRIGNWGFGIYDRFLRTPSGARDYMTYCSNEWVSDYGWEQVFDVIETLSSWDYETRTTLTAKVPLVHGVVYEDGTSDWWTTRGSTVAIDPGAGHTLRLAFAGESRSFPVNIQPIPHSNDRYVVGEVPMIPARRRSMVLQPAGEPAIVASLAATRQHHAHP